MPAGRILQLGDPILRQVSREVTDRSAAPAILADLEATLAEFRRGHGFGRGISAIQLGIAARIIFMDCDGVRYQLINPRISWRSPTTYMMWDDCFSFPNLLVHLRRHTAIRLTYQDLGHGEHELEADGTLSELIQHEMDHLDGVLAVDRAEGPNSLATREEWQRQRGLEPCRAQPSQSA